MRGEPSKEERKAFAEKIKNYLEACESATKMQTGLANGCVVWANAETARQAGMLAGQAQLFFSDIINIFLKPVTIDHRSHAPFAERRRKLFLGVFGGDDKAATSETVFEMINSNRSLTELLYILSDNHAFYGEKTTALSNFFDPMEDSRVLGMLDAIFKKYNFQEQAQYTTWADQLAESEGETKDYSLTRSSFLCISAGFQDDCKELLNAQSKEAALDHIHRMKDAFEKSEKGKKILAEIQVIQDFVKDLKSLKNMRATFQLPTNSEEDIDLPAGCVEYKELDIIKNLRSLSALYSNLHAYMDNQAYKKRPLYKFISEHCAWYMTEEQITIRDLKQCYRETGISLSNAQPGLFKDTAAVEKRIEKLFKKGALEDIKKELYDSIMNEADSAAIVAYKKLQEKLQDQHSGERPPTSGEFSIN